MKVTRQQTAGPQRRAEPGAVATVARRWRGALVIFALLLVAQPAMAQWQTTTYNLKGGWNSIYLHGDASHDTLENLFGSGDGLNVEEVWRWNPNPNQIQFTNTPLLPSQGTPEWSVWVRGGSSNTLATLGGPGAYLVKCTGSQANTYSVGIPHKVTAPFTQWVRNGANLLGFPTRDSGGFPTFSNYFSTFPAAIAANTKIYKYVGGDLGPGNPLQVFSPSFEPLDRNQAYWFESEVVGNFYAPIHVTFSQSSGLDFGRTRSVITARVQNRTSANLTLNLENVASNLPPSGPQPIAVPLTRRTYNAGTQQWTETLIQSAYNEVIPANGSLELSFGIDRADASMTGAAANAVFASILQLRDSGNQFDIRLPVVAEKDTLEGLWVGEAQVRAVESKPSADAITPVGRPFSLRYLLHLDSSGEARVLSEVFVGQLAVAPNALGICTEQDDLKQDALAEAARFVSAHLPLDQVLGNTAGSGSVALGSSLNRTVSIPFDNPTNPFVHQYHPDHDNKNDSTGADLSAGAESYGITREITFNFTLTPPPESSITSGWGSSVIGGTYAETIQGLHQDTTGVGSGNGLQLTGTFELRRASEIGSITTP